MFGSARIRIIFSPDASAFPVSDIDVMRYKNIVLDIKGTVEWSCVFPWISRYPSGYTTVSTFPRTLDFEEYAFGKVYVQMLNPIQNFSATSTTSIGVTVFGSLGEDAEWSNLREVYWYPQEDIYYPTKKESGKSIFQYLTGENEPILVPQPGFTHNDDGTRVRKRKEMFIPSRFVNQVIANTDLVTLFENTFPSLGPVTLTIPDKVNLADVGTRWTEIFSRSCSVFTENVTALGQYYSVQTFLTNGQFAWLLAMFRVLRGSIRVKIIPHAPARLSAVDVRGISDRAVFNEFNMSGWTYGDEITRQPLEFVVPFYRNILYFNASTIYYKGENLFDNWGFFVKTLDGSTVTCDFLISIGPDFRVGLPIVCPPVKVHI
jgi:hypothetical protein